MLAEKLDDRDNVVNATVVRIKTTPWDIFSSVAEDQAQDEVGFSRLLGGNPCQSCKLCCGELLPALYLTQNCGLVDGG